MSMKVRSIFEHDERLVFVIDLFGSFNLYKKTWICIHMHSYDCSQYAENDILKNFNYPQQGL